MLPSKSDPGDPDRPARGRPRDPQLECKVFDAAMDLYGREGWSGFSFDPLARVAGVGKNALYRRWPSKGALLRELLHHRWVSVDHIETGNLHDDLTALCRMLFSHVTGPAGTVGLQLRLDIVRYEAVAEVVADYSNGVTRSARAMVRRAIDRGELPPGTSPGFVLDMIAGTVMSHVSSTPAHMREAMLATLDAYIERLVTTVQRGLGAPAGGATQA